MLGGGCGGGRAGVGVAAVGGSGVDVPHHAVARGDNRWVEGLRQLLLLLPVLGAAVLEPHLQAEGLNRG